MHRYGKFLRMTALAMLLVFLFSGVETAAGRKAVVVKTVDVLDEPNANSSVLGTLKKGTEVTFVKASGKIAQIKYAGKTGYVKKSTIKLVDAESTPAPVKSPAKTPAKLPVKTPVKLPVKTPAPAKTTAKTPAPAKTSASRAIASAVSRKKTTARSVAYLEPSTTCKDKTVVRKGTAFDIVGETGNFYQVKRGKQKAYLPKTAFAAQQEATPAPTPAPTPKPTPESIATKALTVKSHVYKRASKSSKVLGALESGTRVDILAENKSFVKIRHNGETGFVSVKAFREATEAAPTQAPAATPAPSNRDSAPARSVNAGKANTAIASAMAQLGKRYVYGTTGPNTFDCSGLTYYAFKQVGLSLAHSAQSVGYGSGEKVDRSHLQRGDIVCFDTISDSDQSDHVGIYTGNNQFVHASSGQGRVVVSTLSGYYSDHFSWGRRVI